MTVYNESLIEERFNEWLKLPEDKRSEMFRSAVAHLAAKKMGKSDHFDAYSRPETDSRLALQREMENAMRNDKEFLSLFNQISGASKAVVDKATSDVTGRISTIKSFLNRKEIGALSEQMERDTGALYTLFKQHKNIAL